ncbi:MAG TPA: UDP-N-acetylmuramoyl-L-alanyl-D-glutamate--2,6-diaminopimelate ligase [Candidatus Aminicenantes bacterium]|nr:MAG: UDP-N-acetylmuramoyl-L-alanyl-D-glutamate--2,6-diaminopimelate ligase [Candidatus Aminicenantes bacterium]HEK84774.1 UDP-N-acetylmuramoyl-L-alanyl-D-glutamate--2,6-diaminopimelate ligase [Candidatus Aminicenantes bacterium]
MKLKEVLKDVKIVSLTGSDDLEIKGLAYSSRQVEPGQIFVAIKGQKADGHDFIPEALEKGAVAIVSERPRPSGPKTTWVQVPEVREALALMAATFYNYPSLKLKTVGITGTKGKTTVTYILEQIFKEAGLIPGVLGTVEYRWANKKITAGRTTPEAPDIQKILSQMVEDGVTHCLLEVSSHSLELKRVLGIGFDVAIFTNLSGEHLDYHQNMENYFEAKKKLFFLNHKRQASIVNIDDPYGEKLITELPMKTITFGFKPEALVRAESFSIKESHMTAVISYPGGKLNISSNLIGRHNLYNLLAAISAALVFSVPPQAIAEGINSLKLVPGRFEPVANNLGFKVIVDYAHTDNALDNLLQTVRALKPSRIILVFGCGGDRDRSKRPRMGEVAARLADWTLITSDNPRSEDPDQIIKEIEQGFHKAGKHSYEKEVDRRLAIEKAIRMARKGDWVVIAGKGHECYQIFRDKTIAFSDVETAREILKEMEKK